MTDKPVDKDKLKPMDKAFMEFFESQGVTFVDCEVEEEENA